MSGTTAGFVAREPADYDMANYLTQFEDGGVSNSMVADAGDGRCRELFPLPLMNEVLREPGLSVSARRRRCRLRERVSAANEVIEVLNDIYQPGHRRDVSFPCTAAQRAAQHEVFQQLGRLQRPAHRGTEREAVKELLQSSLSYNGEEVSSTLRSYDRDLVSIPQIFSDPIPVAGLLDHHGRETIEDPERCMLLGEDEWGLVVEKQRGFRPYMDEKLRTQPELYHRFVGDLFRAGMLKFSTKPKDLVTPFFVAKKDGRQRLIMDCRGVNMRFRPPPGVALAAGYSWSQLQLGSKDKLHVAQSDIKDYFYALGLPEDLQPFFCLPGIPVEMLEHFGVPGQQRVGLEDAEVCFPMLQVVPMGWNWAMWVAQRVHQHQSMIASNLSLDRILVDKMPAPDLSDGTPVLIPYADNLNVAGTDACKVQDVKDKVVAHLRGLGFKVHEELDACMVANSLGFRIDGELGTVQPIPEKLHRVRMAFRWLSRRPKVSSKAVEKLLGHAVHFAMVRRELLSIFRSLYDFAAVHGSGRTRLPRSAAREAKWISILLQLCSTDLRKSWDTELTASDASLSGIAVCSRHVTLEEVTALGSQKECWRFRSYNPALCPRKHAGVSGKDVFSDVQTVKPVTETAFDPFAINEDFKEVPPGLLEEKDWHVCFAVHMRYPEHITLLEGRGVLAGVRHKLRCTRSFGRRHVHLNDNLATVLIADKGRSSSFAMLRVCRRLAALILASGIALTTRWIPSELNVADHASRRWEAERIRKKLSDSSEKNVHEEETRSSSHVNEIHGDTDTSTCKGRDLEGEEGWDHPRRPTEVAREDKGREKGEASNFAFNHRSGSKIQRTKFFGTASSFRGGCTGLSTSNERVQEVLPTEETELRECDQVRRCLDSLSQQHVRRRHGHQRGKQKLRSSHRCKARLFPQDVPSKGTKVLTGMEQAGSGQHKATTGLASDSSFGDRHDSEKVQGGCSSSVAHVQCLSSPRRSLESAGGGSRSSRNGAKASHLEPSSRRSTRDFKGGAQRRVHHSRLSRAPSAWTLPSKAFDGPSKAVAVQDDLTGASTSVGSVFESGRSASQLCSPLSTQAQRSIARQADGLSEFGGGEEERPLDVRFIRETLRSSCLDQSALPTSAFPDTGECNDFPTDPQNKGPKVFLPEACIDKKIWIVEIFSGSAKLSQTAVKHGYRALAVDVLYGQGCNVLLEEVREAIMKFIFTKPILFVWFGMPCQSWSRARRFDFGPPPLRDDGKELWGRKGLSSSDQQKVNLGNLLLLATILMVVQLRQRNIAWIVENPWTSRCWLTGYFRALMASGAKLQQLDYCQFGMPWKKSTGFCFEGLAWNGLFRTCESKFGRCNKTHKKHIILQGKDPTGVWWTHRAQAYPDRLCHDIFLCLRPEHK